MAEVLNKMASNPDIRRRTNPSKKVTQYLATISACLGSVSAGCALGWSSPVMAQFDNSDTAPFPLTSSERTWISSILAIGALIAAIPSGMCAERFGRKNTILYLSILFASSLILINIATNAVVMIVARFIVGLATGAACVTIPMYINEIAEPDIRGALGSFFQMFLCFGIVISFVCGSIVTYSVLSYILVTVPIALAITFSFMVESPVYLLSVGEKDKAKEALRWLRGHDYDVVPLLTELQGEIEANKKKDVHLDELLASRPFVRGLGTALGLMFFQQFSGINAVMFYTVDIFQSSGSSLDPNLAAIVVSVVQLVFAYGASLVLDKAGRRFYLILSATFMGLSLGGLGFFFQLKDGGVDVSSLGFLPMGSLVIYVIVFALGFGPIPWMMTAELVPAEVKGVASGISVMFNWFLVFLVTKYFAGINQALGGAATFYVLMLFCFLATAFSIFIVPETRGKTPQEIQDELSR